MSFNQVERCCRCGAEREPGNYCVAHWRCRLWFRLSVFNPWFRKPNRARLALWRVLCWADELIPAFLPGVKRAQ